jgi:hypothetical protein
MSALGRRWSFSSDERWLAAIGRYGWKADLVFAVSAAPCATGTQKVGAKPMNVVAAIATAIQSQKRVRRAPAAPNVVSLLVAVTIQIPADLRGIH